jgi:hypothetical protein
MGPDNVLHKSSFASSVCAMHKHIASAPKQRSEQKQFFFFGLPFFCELLLRSTNDFVRLSLLSGLGRWDAYFLAVWQLGLFLHHIAQL